MMGVWKSCEAPGSLLTTYLASIKYFDELDPNKRERSESNDEVLSIEQIPPLPRSIYASFSWCNGNTPRNW